jgi:transcriptional antiterminator RfaH
LLEFGSLVEDGLRWYCVNAHRGQERRALLNIEQQGFEGYLPQVVTRRGRLVLQTPMFSGYLFVRFDPWRDRWRSLWSTFGVRRIFGSTPETPTAVPESVIEVVREREKVESALATPPDPSLPVPEGATVRLKNGVYDLTGICRWSSASRVQVLMTMLGAERLVTVDRQSVEVV